MIGRTASKSLTRSFLDLQGLELLDDVLSSSLRTDLSIDVQDRAVRTNVKGPAVRERPLRVHDLVRRRGLLVWIAEDWIVGLDVLGELLVRFGIVDAGGKEDDVLEGPDVVAARTERLAFGRSTAGECLRKPGKHDGLALVIRQPVNLAIGALELEGGRNIARFQCWLRLGRF